MYFSEFFEDSDFYFRSMPFLSAFQDVLSVLRDKYGHVLEERERYMAVAEGIDRCPVTGQVSAFADIRKLPGGASFVQNTTFIY